MLTRQKVLCCHAGKLHPETERLVSLHAPKAVFCDVSSDHDAYRRAIEAHWKGRYDIIVIEQDMEITAEVLPSFKGCKELWCTFSYQGPSQLGYLKQSLGCTRFSRKLQKMINFDVFSFFPDHEDLGVEKWRILDATFTHGIRGKYGVQAHVHGHLNHFHNYSEDPNDLTTEYAMESQPNGEIWVYRNNPDGTRSDELIRKKSYPELHGMGMYEP